MDDHFALREWAEGIVSSDVSNLNTLCAAHEARAVLTELDELRDLAARMWMVDPPQCMLATSLSDPLRCPDHDPPKCPGCRAHEAEQKIVRALKEIESWERVDPDLRAGSMRRVKEALLGK